ncbi:hypothetical protein K474DRAFT_1583102, partial [Panus rudis PR-1116 ss-1]
YIAQGNLSRRDLPHRTKLKKILVQAADEQITVLTRQLELSPGRISFTCDIWSNAHLRGFMAVTAHY